MRSCHVLLALVACFAGSAFSAFSKIVPRDATVHFSFKDTCTAVQQGVIQAAFDDAISTARATDHYLDENCVWPASLEIFGPQAMYQIGEREALTPFITVINRTWTINVQCDNLVGNSAIPYCANTFIYGGIFSTSAQSDPGGADPPVTPSNDDANPVEMTFCKDFFQMAPLESQIISTLNNATDAQARYRMATFHQNQATTLLRELFHHLPKMSYLPGRITDLWIKTRIDPRSDHPAWFGCYGVACAKLLARLTDDNHWSLRNADNYALYALARFLADRTPPLKLRFPWLPSAAKGVDAWLKPIGPEPPASAEHATARYHFVDKSKYHEANRGYFLSELPDSANATASLGISRKLDLIDAIFFGGDSGYSTSFTEVRYRDLERYPVTNRPGWTNWETFGSGMDWTRPANCNHVANQTRFEKHPSISAFQLEAAMGYAEKYCAKFKDWNPRIVQYISLGNGSIHSQPNMAKHVVLYGDGPFEMESGKGPWLNIGIRIEPTADVNSYLPQAYGHVFDGVEPTERISNCTKLFKHIITNCTVDGHTRGGVLQLRNLMFEVAAFKDSKRYLDEWSETGPGPVKCGELDKSNLYRAVQSSIDPTKACQCWYEKMDASKDIFCKPADGCDKLTKLPDFNATEMHAAGQPCQ